MPAPAVTAVYIVGAVAVVAGAYAFKEFVYEPHIAPKLEAWADSFLESRRRHRARRQGPIAAQPIHEHGNENNTRRSGTRNNDDDARGMSVELEQLVPQEASARSDDGRQDGLRRRRTAGAMDESNAFIPYRPISPTHVIFDSSLPSTPTSPSDSESRLQSPRAVAAPVLHSPSPRTRPASVASHDAPQIPPTPISFRFLDSSRIQSPNMMDMISSRSSSPDVAAMYNTALMGSVGNLSGRADVSPRTAPSDSGPSIQSPLFGYQLAAPIPSLPASRMQSPFSDIHAVTAHSPTLSARSGAMSPYSQLSETMSEFDLPSDSEDDVVSMRSGMFSPNVAIHQEELAFEVLSTRGSDDSWGSVGRRTPDL
ncbi:hypothetical protein FOMPIDRAFT_1036605 [Fomitopsis schrenkii]|uniref:Uncharacterized protein n=1 Tax=Fomitopsis schrenkii TaxID=2126942 RepID=S8E894_FOMSC|nr:hypothetical protein FOMPIDRAFT_1036605 [Fomitopsis schrenkii]